MLGSKIYHVLHSAPATLAFSTLLGIAFAIGHHAFYTSLNDHDTPNTQYEVPGIPYSISGQQINLFADTVFAAITRYWLSYAVSTAFQQVAWRKLRQQFNTLGTIDDVLDVFSNGLLCFSPTLWRRFTNAMLIAVVYWLLPVASFITPATLTVHMKEMLKSQMQLVPQVDFTSLNFAFISAVEASASFYEYEGPQNGVQSAATLALTDGAIQPISPPQANSSWQLIFNAPAITCQSVNAGLHQEITDNIFDMMTASYPNSSCGVSYGYISWIPDSSTTNGSLPFTNSSGNYSLRSGTVGPEGEGFVASSGSPYPTSYPPLSILVAALPSMLNELSSTFCDRQEAGLNGSTILQCSLYNTTYNSNFTYVNGDQTIDTTLPLKFINDVGYIGGVSGEYAFNMAYANGTMMDPQDPDSYNRTFVEIFAYQAVMDAFGKLMVGTVANYLVGQGVSSLIAKDTSIMTTVFLESNELSFLKSADQLNGISTTGDYWLGDSITISDKGSMALKDALEEAFRNITLSLIAEYTLQPNMSSPYAPGMVNVTVTSYSDVYSYSKEILWMAYGFSIFFTLLTKQ